ncbi:MAG: hypothetical protein ACI8Z7_000060 [Candidatus Nanohaloarchaea archaeon]|jgi:hypothetical protein
MLSYLLRDLDLRLKSRKGLDKPIFLVASLTLAIMFLMAYYLATTGWIEGIGEQFNSNVDQFNSSLPD